MSAIALQYILAAIQALPALVGAGVSIATEVEALTGFIKAGKDPTPQQWADQNAKLSGALAALHTASQ